MGNVVRNSPIKVQQELPGEGAKKVDPTAEDADTIKAFGEDRAEIRPLKKMLPFLILLLMMKTVL